MVATSTYMYVTIGAMRPVEDGRPVDVFTPAPPPVKVSAISETRGWRHVACGCDVAVAVAARVRVAVAVCSSVTAV